MVSCATFDASGVLLFETCFGFPPRPPPPPPPLVLGGSLLHRTGIIHAQLDAPSTAS